ncbi:MAG: hypothetical protein IKC58_04755, partial [Clostridia bacterium]|nr:hypothetical protein [Clostridia bacterium]
TQLTWCYADKLKFLASKIESAGASHPPYDGNMSSFCRGGYYPPVKVSWWLDAGGYGIHPYVIDCTYCGKIDCIECLKDSIKKVR